MKLAYMIQAHKNIEQILLLINKLNDEETDIFIHIDKKSELLYRNLKKQLKNVSNVIFVEDRVDVKWGGFSQVLATLKLLNLVLNSHRDYDYLTLLSGQDYPIKNNHFIKEYLMANQGKEFIECKEIGEYSSRVKCYSLFRESKYSENTFLKIIDKLFFIIQEKIGFKRGNLQNLNLYMGSQWFTITYECAQYISEYIKTNPNFIDDFKYSVCSDEHFFQIIIMNSKFINNVANNNLRYIDWSEGESHPKTLTILDYNNVVDSNELFMRKIDIEIDGKLIEKIGLI